ncbi:MAG: hypothetical protein LBT55_01435 [Clostridiaceae bacterium]|jgi:hypothetical protein|nr:hypothetical protein [Clostridiaceae bacterium]
MFENNWLVYILLLLILFSANGGISNTEAAVLIGTVLALVLAENGALDGFFGPRCPGGSTAV